MSTAVVHNAGRGLVRACLADAGVNTVVEVPM